MKISEVKVIKEAAPTRFIPTHYGGPGGMNNVMLHTDGNLYFQKQREDGAGREIVRWNGNPTGEGWFGKWNPATIKGTIVNGQRVPYPAGTNFSNAPRAAAPAAAPAAAQPAAANPTPNTNITGTTTTPNGNLRNGSRGPDVKSIQQSLGMARDEQDGIFGPKTEAAVRAFQQEAGIQVDGVVGPETRAALMDRLSSQTSPAPEPDTAPEPEAAPDPDTAPEPPRTADADETPPPEADFGAGAEPTSRLDTKGETPTAEPEEPTEPAPSGRVAADTIRDRLSPGAQEKFDDQIEEFDGDLFRMLVDAKNQADDFWQRGEWRDFYEEVFGITVSGGRVTDNPRAGIIDINSIPQMPRGRGAANADTGALLSRIKYKTIDDMEESRILDLAGVNMKKKLDEASININGADASEVAEILRMMQLAGADGAKMVEPDDINPGPKPCPICGKMHGPSQPMGGCGSKPSEPEMGDMIRLMAPEEEMAQEDIDGNFADATTEPDDEYMRSNAGDVSDAIPAGNDLHKEKGSYPATAGGDNPMNTEGEDLEETIKSQLLAALAKRKQ